MLHDFMYIYMDIGRAMEYQVLQYMYLYFQDEVESNLNKSYRNDEILQNVFDDMYFLCTALSENWIW